MITCTRTLEFDAAHRVVNHESKCATLHGHRYKVEIEAQSADLDEIGRVIDFSVLKQKIGTWIDENWDHTTILHVEDKQVMDALKLLPRKKDPYPLPTNPTAENMARYLLYFICPMLLKDTGVKVVRVVVWETPNCKATAVFL